MKNQRHIFKTALLALTCFGLAQLTLTGLAVVPAPDGGYPGLNTAEGQSALLGLTTGTANTAVGWFSLQSNTDGTFNTGVGAATLLSNVGNQSTGEGVDNTAIGTASLLFNTTGSENTAVGAAALLNNVDGSDNNAVGVDALFSNTSGHDNTAIGDFALFINTTGSNNTALGRLALQNSNGESNTAIGAFALQNTTTGSSNIAVGDSAGSNVITANNAICIGTTGNDVSDSCYIGNIFGATSVNGVGVFVNSNGRLGTVTSSKRFKEDIKPMADASQTLFSLKPVTFRYRKGVDPEGPAHESEFGLVAEDVEKINPDLVVHDREAKPYSVRYDQVNAMLLNEFLKAHRKMEEQEKRINALTTQLREQAAQIQKVSAQMELSRSGPTIAANPTKGRNR